MASIKTTFSNLPPEILLEIIPHVPYFHQNLLNLRLASSGTNDLIIHHEQSLVSAIKRTQFTHATLSLFPGLAHSYSGLRFLHQSLSTLDKTHTHWLQIVNDTPSLHWLEGRWENIHKAGLLILYRLQNAGGAYESKLKLISSLPATALACSLFTLVSSIHILRVVGPEPMNASYARDDAMVRWDIELAFEELLLLHGPDFFTALLEPDRAPHKTGGAVRYVPHAFPNEVPI